MLATIKQPLSNIQIELLEMFARQVSSDDLKAIKQMLAQYFAEKAMDEADKIWNERGYTQETMKGWLKTHSRTPYKK
jgi:hypothetical protein